MLIVGHGPIQLIVVVGSFVQDLHVSLRRSFPARVRPCWASSSPAPVRQRVQPGRRCRARRGHAWHLSARWAAMRFGAGRARLPNAPRASPASTGRKTRPDHPTGTAAILVNFAWPKRNHRFPRRQRRPHPGGCRRTRKPIFSAKARCWSRNSKPTSKPQAFAMRLARDGTAMTVILNPAPMRPDFNPALLDGRGYPRSQRDRILHVGQNCCRRRASASRRAGFDETALEVSLRCRFERGCADGSASANGDRDARGAGMFCLTAGWSCNAIPAVGGNAEAIDTTGAGDAFVGAFAAALAEFGPGEIERATRFANAGAALSVARSTVPRPPCRDARKSTRSFEPINSRPPLGVAPATRRQDARSSCIRRSPRSLPRPGPSGRKPIERPRRTRL